MRAAELTINAQKSMFWVQEVKMGEGVIRTDPEKWSAIENFPLPRTLKSLRSVLGFAGWYRKFVDNFATISAALTDLLKTKRIFSMSEEELRSIMELKRNLCSAVLRSLDFLKPFYIHCDASKSCVRVGRLIPDRFRLQKVQ